MKGLLLTFFLSSLPLVCFAIPNSFFGNGNSIPIIPAQPRFNAEMTEEFLKKENWVEWDEETFSGPWEKETALEGRKAMRMAAVPIVFGEVPMSVRAYGDESALDELVIHFLDAGMYFGYQTGGEGTREQREAGRDRRNEFRKHFRELEKNLSDRLEDGCGRGKPGALGSTPTLRTDFVDYEWDGFVLRFVAREDYSVSLHVMRKSKVPASLVDSDIVRLKDRDRDKLFLSRVSESGNGDVSISGMPMFTQGNTPFCGIHTLAMAGHYFGLRVSPEALAASADLKNTGSAKGSDLIGLYRAAASEVGLRVSIAPDFRMDRITRSIREGRPVIVWRRVTREREVAHARHRAKLMEDPSLTLPAPEEEDLEKYPDKTEKGSPSHASIVTGFNEANGEVIYTEPWGDETRDRRMRIEEMESSAYAVFSFK